MKINKYIDYTLLDKSTIDEELYNNFINQLINLDYEIYSFKDEFIGSFIPHFENISLTIILNETHVCLIKAKYQRLFIIDKITKLIFNFFKNCIILLKGNPMNNFDSFMKFVI